MRSLYVFRTSRRSSDIEVRLQAVAPALTTEPGLAHTAEGTRRVEAVVGVGPDDAGAETFGDPERAAPLFAPHAAGEAVVGVVGLGDRLFGRAERQHREHRAEDLFARNAV